MQYLAFIPILMVVASIGLSYAGILHAMVGWVLCAISVLIGLGVSITILVTGQSHPWLFAIIAAAPFAVALPMVFNDLRYPRINDVTTNVENPPAFVAAPLAAPNIGRDMAYPEHYGPIVREAYPNVRPLVLNESQEQAFHRVEDLARAQSGWSITYRDAEAGILECEVTTSFFRFIDDLVIHVSHDDGETCIDMRSKSRDGLVDAGANARRIQSILGQLAMDRRNVLVPEQDPGR